MKVIRIYENWSCREKSPDTFDSLIFGRQRRENDYRPWQ